MHDQPDSTEAEDELASIERHQEEEAMRGQGHEDPPDVEEDTEDR